MEVLKVGSRSRGLPILALILSLLPLAATIRWWGRLFFPLAYQDLVEEAALRNGVDPLLVTAVIREESSFDPRAESSKGALGLMQVMPETGAWIAQQLGEGFGLEKLRQPSVNIRWGTWYLSRLFQEFGGDLARTLAAYNAGKHRVEEWQRRGIWDGTLAGLDRLPFAETRSYVIKIMRSYRIYIFLYAGYRRADGFSAAISGRDLAKALDINRN